MDRQTLPSSELSVWLVTDKWRIKVSKFIWSRFLLFMDLMDWILMMLSIFFLKLLIDAVVSLNFSYFYISILICDILVTKTYVSLIQTSIMSHLVCKYLKNLKNEIEILVWISIFKQVIMFFKLILTLGKLFIFIFLGQMSCLCSIFTFQCMQRYIWLIHLPSWMYFSHISMVSISKVIQFLADSFVNF